MSGSSTPMLQTGSGWYLPTVLGEGDGPAAIAHAARHQEDPVHVVRAEQIVDAVLGPDPRCWALAGSGRPRSEGSPLWLGTRARPPAGGPPGSCSSGSPSGARWSESGGSASGPGATNLPLPARAAGPFRSGPSGRGAAQHATRCSLEGLSGGSRASAALLGEARSPTAR